MTSETWIGPYDIWAAFADGVGTICFKDFDPAPEWEVVYAFGGQSVTRVITRDE